MKRVSTIFRSPSSVPSPSSSDTSPVTVIEDNDSTTTEIADVKSQQTTVAVLPPPNLKIKRVDYYYTRWGGWKYRNTGSKVVAEARPFMTDNEQWPGYCFVVIRTIPQKDDDKSKPPQHKFHIKSPYLLKAIKDVMKEVEGVSWNNEPLELEPELFLGFLPAFEEYRDNMVALGKNATDEDKHVLATVQVLLEYLHKDWKRTIATIRNLTSHGEITYELLYAVFVPRAIVITRCPSSNELRALEVVSANQVITMGGAFMDLTLESIDLVDEHDNTTRFGRVRSRVTIPMFKGTLAINSLDAYPIQYHPTPDELRDVLLKRGRKWATLCEVHHVHYKGTAAIRANNKIVKYNLNSRIMVDRATFKRLNANYPFPQPKQKPNNIDPYSGIPLTSTSAVPTLDVAGRVKVEKRDLDEKDLLIASPIVYGFSLSDKVWLEFNVEKISEIQWNDEAFANLVLPLGRKQLLQSLVEAHNQDLGFDDFVQGKGQGLVINLFGPPGCGKTLSAEATSEHVRKPLYVVGAGDLGVTATEVDQALERTFDIATSWKAIILIDEADVFMEQRSLHDLIRNAMVAVFLRHLEYYRGILFLTTNRVKIIDDAFRSRIHVALYFNDLDASAKTQVWNAFLAKVAVTLGPEEVRKLAMREINGRQIKNAVRTATSLAHGRKEPLALTHFLETLDAMDDFNAQFNALASMYN